MQGASKYMYDVGVGRAMPKVVLRPKEYDDFMYRGPFNDASFRYEG